MRFTATIERRGKHGVIRLPFSPNEVWGERESHHVTGSVGPCRIRAAVNESREITLGPAWMRDYPIAEDIEIEVVLQPEGPQAGALAPDIEAALDSDPDAKAFFASLATFYRKGFLRPIESAKKPETRAKNIDQMMRLLKERKKQK